MKSIIIIIAILLVTLTANADWVKSGELEYLQISDSNFTFVKINNESTKIFILSPLEKKMRLWDLVSGRLIRELPMPYKVNTLDYDFNEDILYFNSRSLDKEYWTTLKPVVTWYIDSVGNLKYVYYNYKVNNAEYTVPTVALVGNILYSIVRYSEFDQINNAFWNTTQVLDDRASGTYSNKYSIEANINEIAYKSGIYYLGGIVYNAPNNVRSTIENASFATKWGNLSCGINDTSLGISFNSASFLMLDIDYNHIICSDDRINIKFLSIDTKKLNSFIGKYPQIKVRYYKTIKSIKNAMFLKGIDTLVIYDNKTGKELAELKFIDGKLAFNDANQIVYSYSPYKENKVYRLSIANIGLESISKSSEKKYIFKQDVEVIYCQLEGDGEVSLYDNVGRLVRTYQIDNERYIRKEELERGVYFLSIQTGGSVYHEKVLVE